MATFCRDGLVREEADLLDDVADAPPQLADVARRDVHAVDEDAARGRLDEPVDHLQGRRLAAPRGTDQDADPPRGHGQGEVLDGPRSRLRGRAVSVALADVLELDGDAVRARRRARLLRHDGRP